ncbi:MAG: hypothetical protein H6819_06790 [Phycisphaerales bacterium]|nr:hypothetical protein [Phycisphaerales bacterium]MCB9855288.1 hypothetical protein [Phycisphaerales bacterium]MCB9862881.1 hypothetical protein [Phycisphaerales bacterium]
MLQVTASTFIADPETLVRTINALGPSMAQFVGANFMILPKPISTQELAAAIVATPAGQAQIEEAVRLAVDKQLNKRARSKTRNA